MTERENRVEIRDDANGNVTLIEQEKEKLFVVPPLRSIISLDVTALRVSQSLFQVGPDDTGRLSYSVSGSANIADNNSFEVIGDKTTRSVIAELLIHAPTSAEEYEESRRAYAKAKAKEWEHQRSIEDGSRLLGLRGIGRVPDTRIEFFWRGEEQPIWQVIITVAQNTLSELVKAIESSQVKKLRIGIDAWDVYTDCLYPDWDFPSAHDGYFVWYFRPSIKDGNTCSPVPAKGVLEDLAITRIEVSLRDEDAASSRLTQRTGERVSPTLPEQSMPITPDPDGRPTQLSTGDPLPLVVDKLCAAINSMKKAVSIYGLYICAVVTLYMIFSYLAAR